MTRIAHTGAARLPRRGREVRMGAFYWERHPGGPFATLVAVAASCCSAEAYDGLRPADR